MTFSTISYAVADGVGTVTLNRPEVRNALHSYAYAEMRSCWRDIGLDPNIYVGIVTGTGEAFCAGRDVKFLAQYQAQGKRTPHEDPNNPLFHWGGGGQPQDGGLRKLKDLGVKTVVNLRGEDAHTWVESYFPAFGWIPFEPRAPTG